MNAHSRIDTALGALTVVVSGDRLVGIYFPGHWTRPDLATFGPAVDADPVVEATRAQLDEYFAGTRRDFELPTSAAGTDLEHRVWTLLTRIPYGGTTTYGDLAAKLGDTTARDVGAAVGRNPLSIVVPCHRVVGKDGRLVGYAGGLRRKQELLDFEALTVGSLATLF